MPQPTRATSPTKLPKRRMLQFGMRSLLATMFLVAVSASVWSLFVMPYRNQLMAVRAASEVGGQMTMTASDGADWHRRLVETLLGKDSFVHVQSLDLRNTAADDKLVQHIRAMWQLETVLLDGCNVSDVGVIFLSGLSRLETLSLRYTQTTDSSLQSLKTLPALKELRLTGTDISDEGLNFLASMTSLEEVYARWTQATEPGAAALKERMPQCEVHIR